MAQYMASYDRKKNIAEEIDKLDNEVEKKQKVNDFNIAIQDIKTTKQWSLKEIDNFIGKKTLLEIFSTNPVFSISMWLMTALFIEVLIITVISLIVWYICPEVSVPDMILALLVILLIPSLFLSFNLCDEMFVDYDVIQKIKEKTLNPNYEISRDIIDCPIEVKKELYYRITNDYLYISYNNYYHTLKYFTESGEEKCIKTLHSPMYDILSTKEFLYFKNQLGRDKIYKIADIITDNALK